jgi:ectoine hydroxylase-related dioxygenase (phytanoyl-CoA dioxygenase family)
MAVTVDIDTKINELLLNGFCVIQNCLQASTVDGCRRVFLPHLSEYIARNENEPNRGPYRFFLPMPFTPPCFSSEFFFNPKVLAIVHTVLDDRVVADQWGCDVPLRGSTFQKFHVDYQRPLFPALPDLELPPYMLAMSFGLVPIGLKSGPIQIAPGTHRMPRLAAEQAVENGDIEVCSVPLNIGDVLIRHPWALHRGTPNELDIPRALATIRYVRRWFTDSSREANIIPRYVWETLSEDQPSSTSQTLVS